MKTRNAMLLICFLLAVALIFNLNQNKYDKHNCEAPCAVHYYGEIQEDDVFWDFTRDRDGRAIAYFYKGVH